MSELSLGDIARSASKILLDLVDHALLKGYVPTIPDWSVIHKRLTDLVSEDGNYLLILTTVADTISSMENQGLWHLIAKIYGNRLPESWQGPDKPTVREMIQYYLPCDGEWYSTNYKLDYFSKVELECIYEFIQVAPRSKDSLVPFDAIFESCMAAETDADKLRTMNSILMCVSMLLECESQISKLK
jgi:hypothetical protein